MWGGWGGQKNLFDITRTVILCPNQPCCIFRLTLTQCIWASAWDFQQCGILTCVDSDEPLQPPFKLRNSKLCSFSSLTLIEYSSDKQRLWSDCAYAQADPRLCWSHIPHCWTSHALAHIMCTRGTVNSAGQHYDKKDYTQLGVNRFFVKWHQWRQSQTPTSHKLTISYQYLLKVIAHSNTG